MYLLDINMTDRDFSRFSQLVEEEAGIKMPPVKKSMLEARLRKRLRALGLGTFEEYWDYLTASRGGLVELTPFLDAVTTNKTDFFRESDHFEYLFNTVLPELQAEGGAGLLRTIRVWSAGCSSGKEPYTLAMVLEEYARGVPGYSYSIVGTDLSTRMLEAARLGVYSDADAEPIPLSMRRKYLLRSRDRKAGLVRLVPELRARVRFQRLNFLDQHYGFDASFDLIFFRNVIIYFKPDIQCDILKRICSHITSGGYLFMGHAETIHGMNLPLSPQAPNVYRKT